MTFDFDQWRDWLCVQAQVLRDEGIDAKAGSNDKHSRTMYLKIKGQRAIASFRNWEHGALVDYEVIRLSDSVHVANEAMISVSDLNFPEVFGRFLQVFRDIH